MHISQNERFDYKEGMKHRNLTSDSLLSMEPWAASRKAFKLVWRCQQPVPGFLAKGNLTLVSYQSANDTEGCAQISWNLPYSWENKWENAHSEPKIPRTIPYILILSNIFHLPDVRCQKRLTIFWLIRQLFLFICFLLYFSHQLKCEFLPGFFVAYKVPG